MFRIAAYSLLHERGRLVAAFLGVSIATALALVQIGLYRGFQVTSSTIIDHVGGDFWIVPFGVEVLDYADVMSATPKYILLSHTCVQNVRSIAYGFVGVRKPSGSQDTALIIGVENQANSQIPWSVVSGKVADLNYPLRVSVDRTELAKMHMLGNPLGQQFEINGMQVIVAAITSGIRSFTLNPYIFTSLTNARRLMGLEESQSNYYSVTLKDKRCFGDVAKWFGNHVQDAQILA